MSAIIAKKTLYHRRILHTQRARRLTQLSFASFIIYTSVVHHLATEDGATASIDALCPFGGIETLWRYLSEGGRYIPKTHLSNLVLLLGLFIGTLFAGGAFCGWICPFGSVQDLLTGIRKRLHLPEVQVPQRLDRILRYGRYLMLGLILYQTIATVKLWFSSVDPYRTLFSLDWVFEFQPETAGLAYGITALVLVSSLFVERAWCRYACPLGGAISLVGRFSLLRIRRTEAQCKSCSLCSRSCPVKLPVETAKTISSDCIGCLNCVDTCPRAGALEVQLAPIWLEPFHKKESSDAR
jgi:NapH/MauN family ferredoxin-type protein